MYIYKCIYMCISLYLGFYRQFTFNVGFSQVSFAMELITDGWLVVDPCKTGEKKTFVSKSFFELLSACLLAGLPFGV